METLIYFLKFLLLDAQNNYFFGRTKLEGMQ